MVFDGDDLQRLSRLAAAACRRSARRCHSHNRQEAVTLSSANRSRIAGIGISWTDARSSAVDGVNRKRSLLGRHTRQVDERHSTRTSIHTAPRIVLYVPLCCAAAMMPTRLAFMTTAAGDQQSPAGMVLPPTCSCTRHPTVRVHASILGSGQTTCHKAITFLRCDGSAVAGSRQSGCWKRASRLPRRL